MRTPASTSDTGSVNRAGVNRLLPGWIAGTAHVDGHGHSQLGHGRVVELVVATHATGDAGEKGVVQRTVGSMSGPEE